ncbi:hypothetical protein ACHWQZ_G014946 [Mnemiopsis leidyi]
MYLSFATVLVFFQIYTQSSSSSCSGKKCRDKEKILTWIDNCSNLSKRKVAGTTYDNADSEKINLDIKRSSCRILAQRSSPVEEILISCGRPKRKGTTSLIRCHEGILQKERMKRIERLDRVYLVRANLFTEEDFWTYKEITYIERRRFVADKVKTCWVCSSGPDSYSELIIPLNSTKSVSEFVANDSRCKERRMTNLFSYCGARVVQRADWDYYKVFLRIWHMRHDNGVDIPIYTQKNRIQRFTWVTNVNSARPDFQFYFCNSNRCNERLILENQENSNSTKLGLRFLVLVAAATFSVTTLMVLSFFATRPRRKHKASYNLQGERDVELGEEHVRETNSCDNIDCQEIFIKNGRFSKITLIKQGGTKLVKKQHRQVRNFENEKAVFELLKGHHPSIVFCYDIISSKKTLLMGYYEKGNLRDYLSNVSLSCSQLIELVKGAITAVSYIHGFDILRKSPSHISLAHRDIKTANFLVGPDDTCVLSDFDLSLNLDNLEEGCSLRQVGTTLYMSPELLDCTMLLSAAGLVDCDLYSLGAVLWEIGNLYCQVAVGAPAAGYVHVYQPELPTRYTQSDIVHLVVVEQFRPSLKNNPDIDSVELESEERATIELLGECIADMMDTDCESRISAHCAYNRIFGITRHARNGASDERE